MTWTNQFHRLSVVLVVLGLTLGVVSISHAQRFVRPINSIDALIVSNPNDPHTNVFIPQGPTGPGLFYQWRKNDSEATNANQSVLGSDWPGALGRWYNIPIAQGAIDGISNSGTNGFAVVNTLADLRNVPGNLGIGMVYVRGHSQPDDWGRGFFSRLDDCSIPDDDAYSVHGNDALTCWKRENDLPWSGIPVQYFGGTITVATINRATEYLESIGGGAAFITDGAWLMDTTNGPIILRNSVTIAGSASAVLVGDGYGTMFGGTNIHNAQILEVGISNVVTGVLIRGGTNILIGGNSFFDVGEGVRQYGGDDVRIEVNRFAEVTNGIHLSLDGAVKVTQGALNGNTFSGVVGSNVLEDSGSTDGYQRWDNGRDFNLSQPHFTLRAGSDIILVRNQIGVVENFFIGVRTNVTAVTGTSNYGFGRNALNNLTTGAANTALGLSAGSLITTGGNNTLLGRSSGPALLEGDFNVLIGYFAGNSVTNIDQIVAIGYLALSNQPKNFNTAVGSYSGDGKADGSGNALNGVESGTFFGFGAGNGVNNGTNSVLIGALAGNRLSPSNTNIHQSVVIGGASSHGATNLVDSVVIGSFAATNNISGVTNSIAIGYATELSGNNTVSFGDSNVTSLLLAGLSGWHRGTGSPEGVVTAPVGHYYTREDGGAGTVLYLKESGTGNTGWVAYGSGGGGGSVSYSDLVWTNSAGVVQLVIVTNRVNFSPGAMPTPGDQADFGGTWPLSFASNNLYGGALYFEAHHPDDAENNQTLRGLSVSVSPADYADTNRWGWVIGIDGYADAPATNSSIFAFTPAGTIGIKGEAEFYPTSGVLFNGDAVGVLGLSDSGLSRRQVGVAGVAGTGIANQENVGVLGHANHEGESGATTVGVFGFVTDISPVEPVTVSAAGLFDNTDTGFPVLIGRTNGVEVFSIAGTGVGTFAKDLFVPTEVYDASGWNGDLSVPTKDAVRDKIESLTGASLLAFQQIGSGTDYSLTDTFARVVFGTTGADIVLTNAGTYQIIYTVAAFANNTFAQQYYLRNTTDSVDVPGSYQEVNVSSTSSPLVLAVLYTTSAANKTIQIWGKTMDLTYAGAPKVISTNTVAVVTKF